MAKAKENFVTNVLMKEESGQGGHNNVKQKIKIFSQLKEENVAMKKEIECDKLLKDEYRRKIMLLERQVESLKVVGKPMSRAQRSFRENNGLVDVGGEDKEN